MAHAFLFIPSGDESVDSHTFRKGAQAMSSFKSIKTTDTATSDVASMAVAPNGKAQQKHIGRSTDGQVWLVDLGTWLPLPASRGREVSWLIEQYLAHGADGLARRIQGFFALLVVDLRSRQVHVITDRCGSLHVYWCRLANGHAVCSSSAALALFDESTLDPVAVHEFIATGIIYEDRSLWQGIYKIGPATVLTIDRNSAQAHQYWTFAEVDAESLGLDEAVEQTHHGLVEVLKALSVGEQPIVSDLTGGYDSRFLLVGLLEAKCSFKTTVSGNADHPDVLVAARIARAFGLTHQHIVPKPMPSPEEFDAAVRMTDGEFDAFDFARILAIHRRLSTEHCMSLNGSFGELARGYWWELLWPRLARRQSLDVAMVARKRFAAIAYDNSVFEPAAQLDLARHMAEVAGRAILPIAGFPNTTQMDCVYYSLRMQRWQGRIASSTNQLWPAFSPIAFAQVLDPILAAKANTRFRSLLVRELFARFAPGLARIPLEHGYPPMPATPVNSWRFAPLLGHYGDKVWSKVASRMGGGNPPRAAGSGQPNGLQSDRAALMCGTSMAEWLKSPMLLQTGIFRCQPLLDFLAADADVSVLRFDQLRRTMTIEALLRAVGESPQQRLSEQSALVVAFSSSHTTGA